MLPADQILMQRLGGRLRELREAAELTQDQVGERAGFGGKYVGEIEKGVRDVPLRTLRAIAEHGLGVRIESVFAGAVRRVPANSAEHTRDVELTAAMVALMPYRLRRPLLALVKAIGDSGSDEGWAARAAERPARWSVRKKR